MHHITLASCKAPMPPAVSHAFLHHATEPEANAVKSIPACHTIDNGAGEPLRRVNSHKFSQATLHALFIQIHHIDMLSPPFQKLICSMAHDTFRLKTWSIGHSSRYRFGSIFPRERIDAPDRLRGQSERGRCFHRDLSG